MVKDLVFIVALVGCVLAAFWLVTACDFDIPIETDPSIVAVHDQGKAMLLARADVETHFDVVVPEHDVNVSWTSTPCPYRLDHYAVVYRSECLYGIMWSCDEIFVALSNRDEQRTCGSALVHEYGHCLRLALGWSGDHNHSAGEFWAVNRATHHETCERGW